jgi:transcriptional regulator with XRE-family HTH domain
LEVIRLEREKRGMLQYQLAERLGVDPATLCRYESGRQPVPLDIMAKVVRLFRSVELADAQCAGCPIARAKREITQKWPLGARKAA